MVEDLLHPHVRGAARRAAARGSRLGRPGRRGGRCGGRRPAGVEQKHLGVGALEDRRVLLAHAGQAVDVEEAPVPAGLRVVVEDLGAGLRSANGWRRRPPCGSARCRGRSPSRPRGRSRPTAGSACRRRGSRTDLRGVHHVVAVGRCSSERLPGKRRRQVHGAENADWSRRYGHERARLGESRSPRRAASRQRTRAASEPHRAARVAAAPASARTSSNSSAAGELVRAPASSQPPVSNTTVHAAPNGVVRRS